MEKSPVLTVRDIRLFSLPNEKYFWSRAVDPHSFYADPDAKM